MPDEMFAGIPEVMASLRSFGSGRSTHQDAEPLRFFAPLLDARRVAASARSRAEAVAAFDPPALTKALDRIVAEFASARHAARPPARRALEAELEDALAPLRVALVRLGELAPAAGASDADEAWRAWLEQLRACFTAADVLWPVLDGALARPAPEHPQ